MSDSFFIVTVLFYADLVYKDAVLGSLRASGVIANSSSRLQSSQQVSVFRLIFYFNVRIKYHVDYMHNPGKLLK